MAPKNITVNGVKYVRAVTPVQTSIPGVTFTPTVESPAPRVVCITPGCYKEGHSFSQTGAFGNGTAKGHFDLNPTHARKAI